MPDGQVLFVLLRRAAAYDEDPVPLSMAALDPAYRNDWVECAGRIQKGEGIRSVSVADRRHYTGFAVFRRLDDPRTAVVVDPDDLAATFGAGVALGRIVVQTTTDPVERHASARLPWLRDGSVDGAAAWHDLPEAARTVLAGLR